MMEADSTAPSPSGAVVLRVWRRQVATLGWVASAALAGVLVGWFATTWIMPAAPHLPVAFEQQATLAAPVGNTIETITVEPLSAPEQPAAPHRIAGPAHAPAELAPLYFQLAANNNAAPGMSGEPHDGSDLSLQQQEPSKAPGHVRAGPPHRPAELYLLLTQRGDEPQATMVATATEPRRHPGPPHTMAEVVLLFGVLERERQANEPTVSLNTTWWLAPENSNAAPVTIPLPGERPVAPEAEVAITETGPERLPEPSRTALLQPSGVPMIAILIDDLGLNADRTERTAALPGPLTMAFIPYGEGLEAQTALAADRGHEIFLHLPMEPSDPAIDPGPHALLESLSPAQFARELAWNLDRFEGYVGVNNHMGSLLTRNAEAMAIVMAELHRRGLVFIDSVTTAESLAYDIAREQGIPAARRDIFLDHEPEREAVLAQLEKLETLALKQGFAIGIGHPHDATLAALADWLPRALERGVVLVPASRIIASRDLIVARHAGQ